MDRQTFIDSLYATSASDLWCVISCDDDVRKWTMNELLTTFNEEKCNYEGTE